MELIRAAVLPEDRAEAAWRRWRDDHNLDDAPAGSYPILPVLCTNLSAAAMGADANRLRGIRRRTWTEAELSLDTVVEALDVWNSTGIKPALTGDAALVTRSGHLSGTTTISGINFVTGPGSMDEATRALISAGWTMRDDYTPWSDARAVASPKGDVINLHRWVIFPRFCHEPMPAPLDMSHSYELRGRSFRRLCDSDELLATLVRGTLSSGGIVSRWPIDAIRLASAGIDQADFWPRLIDNSKLCRVGSITYKALQLCSDEFGLEVAPDVLRSLGSLRSDPDIEGTSSSPVQAGAAESRFRRYRDIERIQGRRPTLTRYWAARFRRLKAIGPTIAIKRRARRTAARFGGGKPT